VEVLTKGRTTDERRLRALEIKHTEELAAMQAQTKKEIEQFKVRACPTFLPAPPSLPMRPSAPARCHRFSILQCGSLLSGRLLVRRLFRPAEHQPLLSPDPRNLEGILQTDQPCTNPAT